MNTNTQHTPGPWKVKNEDTEPIVTAGEDTHSGLETVICKVFRYGATRPTNANARLIAAAPALLEALEAALIGMSFTRPGLADTPAMTKARAAIAKAEGSA